MCKSHSCFTSVSLSVWSHWYFYNTSWSHWYLFANIFTTFTRFIYQQHLQGLYIYIRMFLSFVLTNHPCEHVIHCAVSKHTYTPFVFTNYTHEISHHTTTKIEQSASQTSNISTNSFSRSEFFENLWITFKMLRSLLKFAKPRLVASCRRVGELRKLQKLRWKSSDRKIFQPFTLINRNILQYFYADL